MQTDDDRPSAGTETPGEAAGGSVPKHQLSFAARDAKRLTHWAMRRYDLTNGDHLYNELYSALLVPQELLAEAHELIANIVLHAALMLDMPDDNPIRIQTLKWQDRLLEMGVLRRGTE